jgi:hypothetical protein
MVGEFTVTTDILRRQISSEAKKRLTEFFREGE